jgi:hypothetical protein
MSKEINNLIVNSLFSKHGTISENNAIKMVNDKITWKNVAIYFNFENSTLQLNGKTIRVFENSEYTIKTMKTKILACNGIKGLYDNIKKWIDTNFCTIYVDKLIEFYK